MTIDIEFLRNKYRIQQRRGAQALLVIYGRTTENYNLVFNDLVLDRLIAMGSALTPAGWIWYARISASILEGEADRYEEHLSEQDRQMEEDRRGYRGYDTIEERDMDRGLT